MRAAAAVLLLLASLGAGCAGPSAGGAVAAPSGITAENGGAGAYFRQLGVTRPGVPLAVVAR